jgi:hypothetical protein
MKRGGKIFLILGIILCSGFFVATICQASGGVVINEISWMGTESSSNDEWIELRNFGGESVDLSAWSIKADDGSPLISLSGSIDANGYFLLERKVSTVSPFGNADLLYPYGSGALSNDGEILTLYNGDTAIDRVEGKNSSGKGWVAGDSSARQTMERSDDGSWCASVAAGGTPRAENDCSVSSADSSDGDSAGESGGDSSSSTDSSNEESSSSSFSSGSDSSSGYSSGEVIINEFSSAPAEGENEWVELYYPSGNYLSLSGWKISDSSGAATVLSGGFSAGEYFFVAEKFKGALNNDGDEIILSDPNGKIIDRAAYGKFNNDSIANAPAPDKGQSASLKIDGQKSGDNHKDYVLTDTPTPGAANVVSLSVSGSEENSESSADLAITEIFPNPFGSDRSDEFIELYNSSKNPIDLFDWKIEVEGGRSFQFGKFLNLTMHIAAGDYFALYRRDSGLVLDNNGGTVRLYEPEKKSASQTLSYGAAPEGYGYCDTKEIDILSPSGSTKKFLSNSLLADRWVWSRSPTPGRANQIEAFNHAPRASFSAPAEANTGETVIFDASDSFDEDGDGLYFSWKIGDEEQLGIEEENYTFSHPGNYAVKLIANDGEEENIFQKIIKVGGLDLDTASSSDLPANSAPIVLSSPPEEKNVSAAASHPAASQPIKVSVAKTKTSVLSSAAAYKLGVAKKISGRVIVLPGMFGTQYFYILTATGSPAAKIYNYYKSFPTLSLGDEVLVSGVTAGSADDRYLKTKTAADVKVAGRNLLPSPEVIAAENIKEENEDKFVSIAGELEAKSAQNLKIFDGSGDVSVYLKNTAKIETKNFSVGEKISVAGLLQKTSLGLSIVPRGQFDIIAASSSASSTAAGLAGLNVASGTSEWTLPASQAGIGMNVYLGIIFLAGAVICGAVLLIKHKRK